MDNLINRSGLGLATELKINLLAPSYSKDYILRDYNMPKICTKCQEEKELSEFYKRKEGILKVTSQCKACSSAYSRASHIVNKTRNNLKSLEYHAINKDVIAEKSRVWREENKESIAKASSKWKRSNRAHCTSMENKRRASKLQRTPPWLSETQLKEIETFYMIASWYDEPMHVDHIVPLQGKLVSGLHVPWNLQVITKHDNLTKSNKHQGEIISQNVQSN